MDNSLARVFENRQIKILLLIFLPVCALLAIGYYSLFRTNYVVLFNGLRSADAAAIVSELDAKGVSYELRDGGATILVPEAEADSVRLAVTGSDAMTKGTSGFELFNKSDMGLTDFAQKINYQRALQGELARTIMMMDGIADARVHLALPERSLFRGNRSTPKAAVTITMRRGMTADDARVAGVQRLVAASVPDLALSDVTVLDEFGRVVSAVPVNDAAMPADMGEQEAVQQYYRARARAAVSNVLPNLKFDVRVLVQPQNDPAAPQAWKGSSDANAIAPAGSPFGKPSAAPRSSLARRDFSVRISVISSYTLDPQERDAAGSAIATAVGLNPSAGDMIQFAVGPVDPPAAASPVRAAPPVTAIPPSEPEDTESWWASWWTKAAIAFSIIAAALLIRGRRSALTAEDRAAFVARIREQLSIKRGGRDARV